MDQSMIAKETIELSDQQYLVRDSIRDICADFGDDYWRERDRKSEYPHEFVDVLAENGWLGVLIPEQYGGAGMGTEETVVMMEEIATAGGFSAAQAIHGGIYNSVPLVKYGSEKQKSEILPAVAEGTCSIQAFGLTEPNSGSDSTSIETRAVRDGDEFCINGQKIWTSRIDVSDYFVLMARTTPKADVEKRTRGITMFLVDLEEAFDNDQIAIEQIPKTASNCVHSFEVWLQNLRVPADAVIGEVGGGFYQMLDGLNEERLVIAAECIGLGNAALERGVSYANEREVFGQPIGTNQSIQHPLAEAYARVQAARQMVYSGAAAVKSEEQTEIGARANMAKYLAADATFQAADAAVQAHGGFGVAREYDVERYFREARLTRLVPITQELTLNYLSENVLGLPRSY